MKTSWSRGAGRDRDSGPSTHFSPFVTFPDHRSPSGWIAKKRLLAIVVSMVAFGGCMHVPNIHDDPTNAEVKLNYLNDRNAQVNALLDQADEFRKSYQFDAAIQKLYAASQIDPTSERGRKIGALIDQDRRDLTTLQEADRMMQRGSYGPAADRVHRVLLTNPTSTLALQLQKEIDDKIHEQRMNKEEQLAESSIMRTPVSLQFRDA